MNSFRVYSLQTSGRLWTPSVQTSNGTSWPILQVAFREDSQIPTSLFFQEPIESMKLYLRQDCQVGEINAISCRVTREMAGIYTIGLPKPQLFSRGSGGIAGSIIIKSLDMDYLADQMDVGSVPGIAKDKLVLRPYPDQLPPLDVIIQTKSGKQILISGLELLNEGFLSFSQQHTYLARDLQLGISIKVDPLDNSQHDIRKLT